MNNPNEFTISILSKNISFYRDILLNYNIKVFEEASIDNKLWHVFNILDFNDGNIEEKEISMFIFDVEDYEYTEILNILNDIKSKYDKFEILIINKENNSEHYEKIIKEYTYPDRILYLEKPIGKYSFYQVCNNICYKNKLNKKKKNFIASSSHELKTPLNAIIGFSELLSEDYPENEYIGIIKTQGKRMKRIISNLIYLNEVDKIFSKRIFQMNKLRNMVLGNLKDYVSSSDFSRIQWNDSNEDKYLMGDIKKLSLAIEAIIGNALYFSTNTQKPVRINISGNDKEYSISIIDEGIGMVSSEIDHIFKKFYRIESTHHNSIGLGVGLYIAKNIIDKHYGSILVDSEIDFGSNFVIKLPIKTKS
jgi:signal transduction histidine kinase